MSTLHFCRDGILRRTVKTPDEEGEGWATDRVDLKSLEAEDDPDVFLKTLHDVVVLEDGLTVEELFENLAPWAKLLTGIACMDFPAFLEEMRGTPQERAEEIERIVLQYGASIGPVPKFEDVDTPREKGVFRIGRPVRTGRLQLEEGWTMNAMVAPDHRDAYDGAESVSLSFTPLSEWKHVPIVIDRTAVLWDETACGRNAVYLGTEESLTRADHQNVEPVLSSQGDVMGHKIAIDPPSPTFFDAIVRGFLWDVGFHYSPATRNASRDQVMDAMAEVEAGGDLVEVREAGESDA